MYVIRNASVKFQHSWLAHWNTLLEIAILQLLSDIVPPDLVPNIPISIQNY